MRWDGAGEEETRSERERGRGNDLKVEVEVSVQDSCVHVCFKKTDLVPCWIAWQDLWATC